MQETDRADFIATRNVSRETLARLDRFIEILGQARLRSNLIGPKEWPYIWQRHVWDSLQLVDYLTPDARIIDLGSGAGFPGLVLAAALPDAHVTMIESVGKKTAFLRSAVEATGLSANVIQARVESAPDIKADFVTARAFAPLPKLLDYAAPWLKNGAVGLFHKGERWQEELTAAQQCWSFASEAIPSRSSGAGVIARITELESVSH